MTIANVARRADYDGDGVTREFSVPFQFFEISVFVDGGLQTAGVDYNTSQEVVDGPGSVIFTTASKPANGTAVVIIGNTQRVQRVNYVDNDDFPAEVHEQALDRLTMISQEQDGLFAQGVRATADHPPIDPLDFQSNPGTLVYIDKAGEVTLASPGVVLGGVDISSAIAAAAAADTSADAALVSQVAAAASAAAAAISAANAASATAILASNPVFTGLPVFEGGLRVGKNGGGTKLIEFYDDTNATWRSLKWDDTAHTWQIEDSGGTDRTIWHAGNSASQSDATTGTENTKGMTALRVAQAIAALAADGAFPSGTQTLFGNSSAPPGWTKKTDLNDYAIRIVSGTVGTSGSSPYSTVFSSRTPTGTVNGTTLDTTRIPSHAHSISPAALTNGGSSTNNGGGLIGGPPTATQTQNMGGGGSHDHMFTGTPLSFSTYTVDFIRAEKT